MAVLTVLNFPDEPEAYDIAGSAVSADVAGDTFQNDEKTGFWIDNQSGGPVTVTFDAPGDCDQHFTHDAAVVVADAFTGFIAKNLPHARFGSTSRTVAVTYSGVTSVSVAAVRIGA